MEPEPRESGPCQDAREVTGEVPSVERSTDRGCEHEPEVIPPATGCKPLFTLTGSLGLKRLGCDLRQTERSAAPVRLQVRKRQLGVEPLDRVPYVDDRGRKVDVFPPEPEKFSLTEPRADSDDEQWFEALPLGC